MHITLTQRSRTGLTMLSMHSVGTCNGNELTGNSSGYTRPQSSQLTEPLWTDPGLKSGIGAHKLFDESNLPPPLILAGEETAATTTTHKYRNMKVYPPPSFLMSLDVG